MLHPSLNNIWRSIVMRGANVASYKFALGEALILLAKQGKSFVTIEELAAPFSDAICRHISKVEKQITNPNPGKFLRACKDYNSSTINEAELLDITVGYAFGDVIDRFHTVGRVEMEKRFYIDDRKTKKGLTITDEMFSLKEGFQFENLPQELEARWRLVETAWSLNISPHLLEVEYDDSLEDLNINQLDKDDFKRISVTSCRDALNGYQRGKCFYCDHKISVIKSNSEHFADVDHFLPHSLIKHNFGYNINGVWNLVLSCKGCNRGTNGKFSEIPDQKFLYKLDSRNDWFISSHHPLRETIINQTGKTPKKRKQFLSDAFNDATKMFPYSQWRPI